MIIVTVYEEAPSPSAAIFDSFLISSTVSLVGAVLLSQLSWVFESPAARSSLSSLDRAAARRRYFVVRILMPLLAGGVMVCATWIVSFALVAAASRVESYEIAFGARKALTALGTLIFGALLWSAGSGWGENDYRGG
ncbi:MAG: hypothetical protein ACLFWF_14515 [Alphaproteobacteria bacterium]